MNSQNVIDEKSFRRILSRNVSLPIGVGVLSAAFFVCLVAYLLNVLKWVEHTDQVLSDLNQVYKLTIDQETGMRGFLLAGDERFLDPYEVAKPRIRAELESLREMVSDNQVQVNRLGRIVALNAEWDKYAQQTINLRRAGSNGYQEMVGKGQGKRLTDEIRGEFDAAIAMEVGLRTERNQTANQATIFIVGTYLVLTLAFSAFLAYSGRREMMRLSETYSEAMDKQIEHSENLQRQAWLRTGQTRLAEQMIGHQDLGPLGRSILQFLAQYLDVAVGALYIREHGGGLKRIAAYGFSREMEELDQSFYAAEGLVGQAVLSQRIISLRELPENYLKITSGLGQGAPRNVLLLPISNEGTPNGVIELGFLREPGERDLAYLELISSNVGSSVEAARYRQRLQEVLAETQQLNEELQVQQEELKTANEELEEQSRVLKESQAYLESQQAELEQTNEQLGEQAVALDQKNAALNRAQLELEARADELQRASRYKSEFLANMSHELRTPLNSSLILAKLLADNQHGNLSAEQVKFADSIYSAGNDLLNLINDILDISKVEAGKLEVRPEHTSVERLLESLKMTFEPLAVDKKLHFTLAVADDAPKELFTDRQRVEQVLKNLLANAVKFTEQGGVTLAVSGQPGGGIAFAVRDTGIGIRADQQEAIFEAFRQADGTTNRRYGGTGLGLSISRDLANLLGGAISVSSAPGQGSVFTLILPESFGEQAVSEVPAVPMPPTAPLIPVPLAEPPAIAAFADDRETAREGQRCVLVVEDEPKFAQILYDLAHELGYRCLVAMGADDGFQLARQQRPDAILLDMRLPDGSGLTVLQMLKEDPLTRHIPVHVISVEDRMETAMQMGAIGYAVKPTTREQLKEVFGRLEAKLTQKVKRILLVEDDALQRDSIARLIGDDDVEITAVEFGHQALELLRTTIFDCMVIDLKLPDIQGNELLRRMASENIRSYPPVIVYTGRNLSRDEEAELLRYSRTIIIKGARSPERLLDEVTLFLHKVESELSSDRQKMLRVARSRDKMFEGRRILLVDDDVRNIFALTSALEQKGAVVEVGRNGREAIERLNEMADIDLVLMDVMMPEMDGYEATREIRKNPRWQKLPIISVTAKAMKDDQERCLQAGANDYLAKPIDLDRLFALIRVWMPKLERV
jgi:CheY-like chemotaxis protein/CHASE3 domain sensor protein